MSVKIKQVRLHTNIDQMLEDLVKNRKEKYPHLTTNKQSLVADLIVNAHKQKIRKD